tara:strand:- start:4978 stop:6129 length:1152 start_codon:yes stop_codon:yes gene_type:complete
MAEERIVNSDLDYSGPSRNLLIFMDGTWNDENGRDNDGMTTNIYKLFRALEGELTEGSIPHSIEHDAHLALYFRGIGNDDDNSMLGSTFYGVFGGSEKRIRDHAYVSIVEHYRKGDKISILGFSRGAATARLLASDLRKEGIVQSLKVYYQQDKNESTDATELIYKKHKIIDKTKKEDVLVHFLGIFDTVGAFGIPVDFGLGFQKINLFKDLTVSSNVQKVVHCIGIDENRKPFMPSLCNKAEHIDEVWFAGVHSDIGGGYRHANLSKIPLKYMLIKLKAALSAKPIAFNSQKLEELTKYTLKDEYQLHYHGDGLAMERRKIKVIEKEQISKYKPRIHSSVFKLMRSKNIYLATPLDGFSKIEEIRYCPRSVNGLMQHYEEVD